jgi:hypothetical protein
MLTPFPPMPRCPCSYAEQLDVEAWLLSSNMLFPTYHKAYWIGLASSALEWPRFGWLDGSRAPVEPAFANWGAVFFPSQVSGAT